jgi:hypothetical protein
MNSHESMMQGEETDGLVSHAINAWLDGLH